MKKFNRLIIISILAYLLVSAVSGISVHKLKKDNDSFYLVEINRIMHSFSDSTPNTSDSYKDFSCILSVDYISADAASEDVSDFFNKYTANAYKYLPYYYNDELSGYLRFEYQISDSYYTTALILFELSLFALELFVVIILLHIRKKVIVPFNKINELPKELAQGHFSSSTEEDKRDYFKAFTRSLGLLKDTLAASKKRELTLLKEKQMLLLSLSHDIKTPLNAIKLYSKALHDNLYTTPEQQKEALTHINEKSDVIENYIEKIMSTARDEIVDINIQKNEFYLDDLVTKITDTYQVKCKMRLTKLTIEKCSNRIIFSDINRLFEVVENLFENAFKYGDGREIKLSFYEEEYRPIIRIYNSGEPISENDINHIFDSFFRGSNSTHQQGNGLGLYICREIMHKLGGEIYAERKADGMAFVIVV